MSHHIYQTEGFVVGGTNSGEGNKYITLFTKELGMVRGSAQGVRLIKSKLRFSLQDFSYSKVSLVRGKEVWRVTNASYILNLKKEISDKELFLILARAFSLLKRLVVGEGKHEKLYEILQSFIALVTQKLENRNLSVDEKKFLEYILVLRMLQSLGYIGNKKNIEMFTKNDEWDGELLDTMKTHQKEVLSEINQGLKATHL